MLLRVICMRVPSVGAQAVWPPSTTMACPMVKAASLSRATGRRRRSPRGAHASDRLLGDDGGAACLGVAGKAAHHFSVDDAESHGVDADALCGVVESGGLAEADQAVLGRSGGVLAGEPL